MAGLTFLVTGVLESLERDECGSIIKEYGGKTMTVVGKRLNYLIVGEDAGPKKLAQAEEQGVKIISEDGFFDLIRERSGMKKESGSVSHNDLVEASSPSSSTKEQKQHRERDEKEDKKSSNIKKEKSSPQQSPPKKKPKLAELNNNLKKAKLKLDLEEERKFQIKQDKEKTEKHEIKNEKINENKTQDKVKEEQIKQEFPIKAAPADDMMAWVDKYKPMSVKDIIGQQGPNSNVTK